MISDPAGIVNVLAGATGLLPRQNLALIVELHGHADHVIARFLDQGGRGRAIDAAGHGDDDAGVLGLLIAQAQIDHGGAFRGAHGRNIGVPRAGASLPARSRRGTDRAPGCPRGPIHPAFAGSPSGNPDDTGPARPKPWSRTGRADE